MIINIFLVIIYNKYNKKTKQKDFKSKVNFYRNGQ